MIILKYLGKEEIYEDDLTCEARAVDLAFNGIGSIRSEVVDGYELTETYEAFDRDKFLAFFTPAQYDALCREDHRDTGYMWYRNLQDGDTAAIQEVIEMLEG